MNLYCDICDTHTAHDIRPWQLVSNKFNAVSILCRLCDKLSITDMSKASVINLEGTMVE